MDLTQYTQTPISDLKERFNEVRFNPTMLVKAEIETVQNVTQGKAILVDPTNPFVMCLEMAAVISSNCIQENLSLLRRQYPVLAQTPDELYVHMSDEDYLNRFASPATGRFTIAIQVAELFSKMVRDDSEDCDKAIIARDTTISVDSLVFTLLYPVVIRRYSNGMLQISYDPTITNPVYSLKNTIIDPTIRQTANLDKWLFFDVDMLQVDVDPSYYPIERTYNFKKTIVLNNAFYHARVFYSNTATQNNWVEIATTHSDQVFDISKPTAVLKVLADTLEVSIPPVYIVSGALSGQIRVDVYTTNGEISVNLQNFRLDAFTMKIRAIDEKRDLSDYTNAFATISYYTYSLNVVAGGKAALTFEELRARVIDNSTGPQNLPITTYQLQADVENIGFTIEKNIDTLTNRVFLATKGLPAPSNQKLITAANIGMITVATTLEEIATNYNVVSNGNRLTILSKSLWLTVNGKTSILSKSDLDAFNALTQTSQVSLINAGGYTYSPFHCVLDASNDEFSIRSYALDQPYAMNQNFVRQNQTLQLLVNTGAYTLKKVASGYELRITTKSGQNYQNLEDSEVGAQLAFSPENETTYAYINGVLESKTTDGERIYLFKIETNYDVNSDDFIAVTNSSVAGVTDYKAWVALEKKFYIIHYTTSITANYVADKTDLILGKFLLNASAVGNSLEEITIHFGDALKTLWSRSRSYLTDTVYKTYQSDVPLIATEDVLKRDPVTGSAISIVNGEVVYDYLYRQGDQVLDIDGNLVYAHRAGDVVIGSDGNPEYDISAKTGREFDLFVVDARYFFASDSAFVSYRNEIEATVTAWIVDDLANIQDTLLEQTRIYFYPKNTVGKVQIYTEDDNSESVDAEQSFTIDLYVPSSIYSDGTIRESLVSLTIKTINSYLSNTVINMTDIASALRVIYGNSVSAFKLSGLGGSKDLQFVRVALTKNQLFLRKSLVIQPDKTTIVEDDITINFKKIA